MEGDQSCTPCIVIRQQIKLPASEQEKRDIWFLNICKVTNSDMARFFDVWKVPVSDTAKQQVKSYKAWFPKELE